MNTARIGSEGERQLSFLLTNAGWEVEKARVSRGVYDLVAWRKDGKRFLIQAKTNEWPKFDGIEPLSRIFKDMATPLFSEEGPVLELNMAPASVNWFTEVDPVFHSFPSERLWAVRWTHRGPLGKKGTWSLWRPSPVKLNTVLYQEINQCNAVSFFL